MDEWLQRLADELQVEADVPVGLLLDVARVAAHSVERRAAPLSTFLVGVAVGAAGPNADVEAICRRAVSLAAAPGE